MRNDSMSLKHSINWIRHYNGYVSGSVVTPHGIVSVYSQGDEDSFYASQLHFAFNQRLYTRHFDKRYTPMGLVTKARRFAKEIIDGMN